MIEQLYTAAPAGSVVICLDEMGPQAAKSYPGQRLVKPAGPEAERARLHEQQHQAQRWTFLGSGIGHPNFLATVGQFSPASRQRLAEVAAVFS